MKEVNTTASTNNVSNEATFNNNAYVREAMANNHEALTKKLNEQMQAAEMDSAVHDVMKWHNIYSYPTDDAIMALAMSFGVELEKCAESTRGNHEKQMEMVCRMFGLAVLYHSDLTCTEMSALYENTRVFMLSLARVMLEINYGVNLHIDNMIYSQTDVALSRATMTIRNECRRFLKSREFLDYLKENGIAFLKEEDNIIIQILSGSFNVNTGRYEYGHILSVDGICLDPSMKGWDMAIFLMYT